MPTPEEHLRQWTAAGLIDSESAARIAAFERGRAATSVDERPGLMEVLVYLGIAVIAVGVFILVTISWSDLDEWARLVVTAGPAAFALLVGQIMRSMHSPGLARGGQVAWLAATALTSGATAVLGANQDWSAENTALVSAAVATALAVALWVVQPSHLQVIGMAGALFFLAVALGARSEDHIAAVVGLTMVAFAAAAVVFAEAGWLVPLISGRFAAALGLAVGAFLAAREAAGYEPLAFAAAAILLALGIWRATFIYLFAGVALLFVSLIASIVQHVDDPSMQAGALIVLGALLVAVVLSLARWQPWKQAPV